MISVRYMGGVRLEGRPPNVVVCGIGEEVGRGWEVIEAREKKDWGHPWDRIMSALSSRSRSRMEVGWTGSIARRS